MTDLYGCFKAKKVYIFLAFSCPKNYTMCNTYQGGFPMGLNYNDLSLLRFIQKRQYTPLYKVAAQFNKNETSIRRTIEQINLYSPVPMVEVQKNYCISRVSYEEFVSFIQTITMEDYVSSWTERIQVLIVTIFFHGYVNTSRLYESWGLSLTTKKQDTAHLRRFLLEHGLELVTLKRKGLSIQGDDLQLRFLVINILHPLLEFTAEDQIQGRYANTPIENQSYQLAAPDLLEVCPEAVTLLNRFLTENHLSLNYPSKKFLLLFICFMLIRPVSRETPLSYRLPLTPFHIHFFDDALSDQLWSVAVSMMNFSQSLKFPMDRLLWQTTERFAEDVVAGLEYPFPVREEFIRELYGYFYREICLNHFHCTFVDKTVENTRENFPFLYNLIQKYLIYFHAAFHFQIMDEHICTLTLLVQKHILRNQIVARNPKKIVVMTSINFERISYFLEQLRDRVSIQWMGTFNINELHMLDQIDYDYILCFSARILNILNAAHLPVIRLNFFVSDSDIDILLRHGFPLLRHRCLASSFALEIAGKNEAELVDYLKEQYGDYFV